MKQYPSNCYSWQGVPLAHTSFAGMSINDIIEHHNNAAIQEVVELAKSTWINAGHDTVDSWQYFIVPYTDDTIGVVFILCS